ncbi:MAG: hypothetical protein LBD43_01510 [Holosporales bacterium]|jgi:TolA-binding protein|nr:hypothetical protein [Holosporales bacterium]
MSLGDKQSKKSKQEQHDGMISSMGESGLNAGVDRKLLINCVLSVAVAMVATFATMKIGMSYHDDKIQELLEQCSALESKIKSTSESVIAMSVALTNIQTEMKADKETAARVYSSVSSLQGEIESIKKELHIEQTHHQEDAVVEKHEHVLSPKEREVEESLGRMVDSGIPFADYVESKKKEVDLAGCSSYKNLMRFSKEHVKSVTDLMKECTAVGEAVFSMNINESFWEKHKRIIKEKIVGAIKFGQESADDDKTLFKNACQKLADGDIAGALALFQQIKTENEELNSLIAETKKRAELNDVFATFKEELHKKHESNEE